MIIGSCRPRWSPWPAGPASSAPNAQLEAGPRRWSPPVKRGAENGRERLGGEARMAVPALGAGRARGGVSRSRLAHWGPGTKPRLALGLLLFTGARRQDMVTFGKQHIKGSWISTSPRRRSTSTARCRRSRSSRCSPR